VSHWSELDRTLLVSDGLGNIMQVSGVVEAKPKRDSEIIEIGWKINVSIWSELDSTLMALDRLRNVIQVSSAFEATRERDSEIA